MYCNYECCSGAFGGAPRGGARGGRGGRGGAGGATAVDKGRRREKEHHVSGTGRDAAAPKGGAGKGNWGTGYVCNATFCLACCSCQYGVAVVRRVPKFWAH